LASLDLWQQVKSAHTRHVDVQQQEDDLVAGTAIEHVQSRLARAGKVQPKETLPHFPAELLPEQRLRVRLIIDHQHPSRHGTGPPMLVRHGRALLLVAMLLPGWPRP